MLKYIDTMPARCAVVIAAKSGQYDSLHLIFVEHYEMKSCLSQ